MSTKPNDLELEYIHQIATGSSKVQDLIQAKNVEAMELQNKQSIRYKTPSPAPCPQGDIRLSKIHHKTTMNDKSFNEKLERSNSAYDSKIKEEMDKLVQNPDHEGIRSKVHGMNSKELSTLSEKGVDIYKQSKEIEEKNLEESLKLDFDNKDNFKDYQMYDDFLENSKSMEVEKSPSPSDDYE